MRYIYAALLITYLMSSNLLVAPPRAAYAQDTNTFVQQVVELTNAERASAGLPPLKLQQNLCDAAMWMTRDMAENDYFSHTDTQGRVSHERITAFAYTDAQRTAENLAAGQPTPADVVAGWLASPAHRAHIFDPDVREIGVGYFFQPDDQGNVHISDTTTSGPFRHYWAQDFGRRDQVYPVIINDEAASSSTLAIDLYIYGAGWADEMRLSNDGTNWTDWEAYQDHRAWTLADGQRGTRTVYVELRQNSTGAIIYTSDTIELTADVLSEPAPTPDPEDDHSAGTYTVYLPTIRLDSES